MMIKVRVKIIVAILTVLFALPSSLIVLNNERYKKLAKASGTKEFYKTLASNYEEYLKQRNLAVSKARSDNTAQMSAAEKLYNELLAQEQALIAQHTHSYLAGTTPTTAGSNLQNTNSSNTTSTTKTVTVKPSSSRTTSSS
jgi:hypothetical protein